jgi:glycosyltransferase involved in cell wall biosynthesis
MKILVFSNLPPFVMGGAENQVARLISAWVKLGNQVEVCGHRIPSTKLKLGNRWIRTHQIRVLQPAGRLGRAVSYLIATLFLLAKLRRKFDIIYCRGIGDAAISICLAKSLRLIDLPLVACPINAKGEGDASFIKKIPGWPWIIRCLDRQLNGINVIAPAIADDLKALKIQRPAITFIPNGIAILSLKPKKDAGQVKKLIFTGRLSPQKGLDLMIHALAELHKANETFVLHIIGNGPLKNDLEALIHSLSLDRFIHLLGEVPVNKIRDLLFQYDAFVLPSRYEGMSNSALEAMETGLPVLTTRCGGIDTYITSKIGWVCEPDNLADLTKSLGLLLATPPPELVKMGVQARLLVEEKFDLNAIARSNLALFEKIILKKSSENKLG